MLLLEMLQDGEDSHLDYVEKAIHNRNYTTYDFRAVGETTSTLTDEEHKANIRKGIAHCMRGDVFQIVLSRRFIQRYEGDDFKLYRALRSINPSPYLFYFDFGGFRIFEMCIRDSPHPLCAREERQKMSLWGRCLEANSQKKGQHGLKEASALKSNITPVSYTHLVDGGTPVFYFTMGFGRGTENTEASEIEVK